MSHLLDVHFWLLSNRDRDRMIMCDNCRLDYRAACFDSKWHDHNPDARS